MTYTATHQGGNFWIVVFLDEEGNQVKNKKVFLNEDANTEADAIEVATAEPIEE